MLSRPDPPQVQVAHPVAPDLQQFPDGAGERRVGDGVEQDGAGVAGQAPGPAQDDAGADQPDHRVHEHLAEQPGREQADDGQDRGRGVGQDVDVGRAQVEVAGVVVRVVVVGVIVVA
jgi:hypothetical protein